MKLIKGKIIAGESCPEQGVMRFTIETGDNPEIVIGANASVFSFTGFDKERLQDLLKYLMDRPTLTNDKEVQGGLITIKRLLG